MQFLKIYWQYIKMFIRARMEYRVSFFMGIFSNFYCYFVTYIIFWIIVSGFGTIGEWNFSDITILYGLNLITYSVSGVFFWGSVYNLEKEITSGNLDSYLLKPMGVIQQLICRHFGDTFIGQILVSVIFMAIAFANLSTTLNIWGYLYCLLALIGGVLIQAGAMIIGGSMSFWFNRSRDLADIFLYEFRNILNYPLDIFPEFIRMVFTLIIPWAFINYYPSLIVLHKAETCSEIILGFLSPFVGIVFFTISILVFNRGLRRYTGSGS